MPRHQLFLLVVVTLCLVPTMAAQSQILPCPGFNASHNTTLACELPTATGSSTSGISGATGGQSLASLSPTLAAALSNLPIATAVSGTGIALVAGIPTFSTESLGTILTQRGETLGENKFFVSFNYQRFGFGSLDGVSLKSFGTVNGVCFGGTGSNCAGGVVQFVQSANFVNLVVDQYTVVGSYGLTKRVDLSVVLPFSTVNMHTIAHRQVFISAGGTTSAPTSELRDLPGSASGIGDVVVGAKLNIYKGERLSMATGMNFRFKTGDATNYLGSGAYGVKPYFIISHRGRITPNLNVGYQWNSRSILFANTATSHLRLPSSLLYSGGADFRVNRRFTLIGEFLGQYVFNGPQVVPTTVPIGSQSFSSLGSKTSNFAMNTAGGGFKISPYRGLLITASAMFKLDDPGLRSKIIPLFGASYRF